MSDNAKEKRGNSTAVLNLGQNVQNVPSPSGPKCDTCEKNPSEVTCPKCEENFCRSCDEKRHSQGKSKEHKRVPFSSLTKIPSRFCSVQSHSDIPLTVFCNTCTKPICSSCEKDGEHKSHSCVSLKSAVEGAKLQLTQTGESVRSYMEKMEVEIKKQEMELVRMKESYEKAGKLLEDTKELMSRSGLDSYIFLSMFSEFKVPVQFVTKIEVETSPVQKDIKSSTKVDYEGTPVQIFKLPKPNSAPLGCTSDNQHLYICDSKSSLLTYTLDGDFVENKSIIAPSDIDFYKNQFYVINKTHVSIFNLKFQLLSSFTAPFPDQTQFLKVDNNLIYITGLHQNQVFIHTHDGKIKTKIGSIDASNKPGEFYSTRGMTFDTSQLYVCDCNNHRIQVFSKENKNYAFITQWGGTYGTNNGEFISPKSIYYSHENIFYVGDYVSVQLFTCEGKFLQRIGGSTNSIKAGGFTHANGICVINNLLYISDASRIQVFWRK